MAVWLIACVIHASAVKFLDRDLVADAQAEKDQVATFLTEVVDQGQSLQKALAAEKEKNKELEATAKHAVAELKKSKAAFAEELHKVELLPSCPCFGTEHHLCRIWICSEKSQRYVHHQARFCQCPP